MRVVIVGGGIAGAVAATTLRTRLGSAVELVVLERSPRLGGRVDHREIAGVQVETGATLFHSSNRLIARSAHDLGLESIDISARPRTVGIWDGDAFVLRTAASAVRDRVSMLARYRTSLVRASSLVRSMVKQLEAVYDQLDRGRAWQSPAALLDELGLAALCRERAWEALRARHLSTPFICEFVDGVSRNNYGQDAHNLSAFVELVSLAGAGLGGGGLRSIRGGNRRVCEGLIARAGAKAQHGVGATSMRHQGARWAVATEGGPTVEADSVVLAAPLELADMALTGAHLPWPRSYKTIHATFVTGHARPGYFRAQATPDFILTTARVGNLLSIERVAEAADGMPLYKVFSLERLDDRELQQIFDTPEAVRIVWRAYPELSPSTGWPPFRLAEGLYYPSAMEYAVSTMETQAIAGTAAANLLVAELAIG